MQKTQSVRVRANVKQPLTSLLTAKASLNLNSAYTLCHSQTPQSSLRAGGPDPSTAYLGQMPVLCLSKDSMVLKAKDTLHYVWQVKHLFYNVVAYDIIIRSGNGDIWKLISKKYSCILLSCERSQHMQFAMLGTISEGGEFEDIMIFWLVEVRGDFVLKRHCLAETISKWSTASPEALQPWSLF